MPGRDGSVVVGSGGRGADFYLIISNIVQVGVIVHILFLTDNFYPEVNAPANRTFEHCREWVKKGHEVTVVTCVPNFPKGEVFPGYRNRLWQEEKLDGIRVIRVWTYITANKGTILRALDYLSFMFSSVIASAFVRSPDVVVGTSPQFFTAVSGYLVGLSRSIPFVFELRDLWPESIRAVGVMRSDSLSYSALTRLELFLYRRARLIVTVTNAFASNLVNRSIDGNKIRVITNGVDLTRFQPVQRDASLVQQYGLADKFVVGYIGTHGMAHALETVLDAADIVSRSVLGGKVAFLFLGNGARKEVLRDKANSLGLQNVVFVDSVGREEVARYWSLLDASIIHLRNDETFRTVIPSKLFESLAMGVPILHGVPGESADIVKENEVGLTFDSESPEGLVENIVKLVEDESLYEKLRGNCLIAAKKYDRRGLAIKMLDCLESVVGGS